MITWTNFWYTKYKISEYKPFHTKYIHQYQFNQFSVIGDTHEIQNEWPKQTRLDAFDSNNE